MSTYGAIESGLGSQPGTSGSNTRLQQTQAQVDEVKDLMEHNVKQALRRGDKLEELDERAENLASEAANFGVVAKQLKRKYWWQNKKMTIILAVIALIIIAIVIAGITIYNIHGQ